MSKKLIQRYEELLKPQVAPLLEQILKKSPQFMVTPKNQTRKEKRLAKELEKFLTYLYQEEHKKIIKSIIEDKRRSYTDPYNLFHIRKPKD